MSAARPRRLRIIGGRWRGRRISFAERSDLRPTPDRVRETLFNWLEPVIDGASCLDLFTGSGILTLEALSRGAAHVTAVDHSAEVMREIDRQLGLVAEESDRAQVELIQMDAIRWLQQAAGDRAPRFDVVFIDPPFAAELAQRSCQLLAEGGLLASGAYVYIETAGALTPEQLPGLWRIHRQKRASQVHYCLCRVP